MSIVRDWPASESLSHRVGQARNELLATQAVIARMIGVRRSSVTMAATSLQRQGLIHYRRGRIAVLDREGLAAASCSCYERIKRQHPGFLR